MSAPAWVPLPTKKATREAIEKMLATDDRARVRAMLAIYAKQTEDEKCSEDVKHDNGVGFTVRDARLLSSYTQQFLARGWLSEGQMVYVRKMMPKYAGQLTEIAIAKYGKAAKAQQEITA